MNPWWKALIAAALAGAATATADALAGEPLDRLWTHALVGALVGVAAYLKRSPISPSRE